MDKKILSTAGFFGMTAIILGAFGAHAFKTTSYSRTFKLV
jgi:uncharacterized membrane protein YgdD (TMEM256/DUF423 family)